MSNNNCLTVLIAVVLAEICMACGHNRTTDTSDVSVAWGDIALSIKGDGPVVYKTSETSGRLMVQTKNHYAIFDENTIIINGMVYDASVLLTNIVVTSNNIMIDGKQAVGNTLTPAQAEEFFPPFNLDLTICNHQVKIVSHIFAGIKTDIFANKYIRMGEKEILLCDNYIRYDCHKIAIPRQAHLIFADEGVYCQPIADEQQMKKNKTITQLIVRFPTTIK